MSQLHPVSRFFAALIPLFLIGPARSLTAQQYTCLPASDDASRVLSEYLVSLVEASDSASVLHRERYHLPVGKPSSVRVVVDLRLCRQAGTAYHAVMAPRGERAIDRRLVLIRVGNSRFVVRDPDHGSGEFLTTLVFSGRWIRLAGWDS